MASPPPHHPNGFPSHPSPYPSAASPPAYQHSPMSPTAGGPVPPAKRQRTSPNPPSPAMPYSPFDKSPYHQQPYHNPPYAQHQQHQQHHPHPHQQPAHARSQPTSPFLAVPPSPVAPPGHASFHQPQAHPAYQHEPRPPPSSMSMPPPKLPASRAQDPGELEKVGRDTDVNNISDVVTAAGVDLRAEEEFMNNSFGNRHGQSSFTSQASANTLSPHGSFGDWAHPAAGHGAFHGAGALSQPTTEEQQKADLDRRQAASMRALHEATSAALADPFLFGGRLRYRISETAYRHGITADMNGLFDRIKEKPTVTRNTMTSSNGEAIVEAHADSLLTHNAPYVEFLSILSLAAEERLRTILEDAFSLAQVRQNTSHGTVPPSLTDLAAASGDSRPTTAIPVNLSKTAWDAPDSAVSPMTVPPPKNMNSGRLPTPPTDAPPTPLPTVTFTNHVANALKRKVADDYKFEQARIAKRQKRLQGSAAATPAEPAPLPLPTEPKVSKKEQDRIKKLGQTDDVLHRKANETASMALGFGKKKKYSWMTGGGGGASGAATPRINTNVGAASGTATPAQPQQDRDLVGRRRAYGTTLEAGDVGKKIQVRDIIHVLELDGRDRRSLVQILARLKNSDKDDEKPPSLYRSQPRSVAGLSMQQQQQQQQQPQQQQMAGNMSAGGSMQASPAV